MWDNENSNFDPEKMTIFEFRMVKGQVDAPLDFDKEKVTGHHLDNSLELGFNLEEKLIKADITIEIRTESSGQNSNEAIGYFHLVYFYQIDNLEELIKPDTDSLKILDPKLANALSSVTYSTSRGVLLTRLQGTALQQFILPVINPQKLLLNNRAIQ